MYLDHSVSVVYLTTAQGEQFSNGTDFRTILHYKTANEDEKIANYLESIYKL
jgi:enoyl-CoA hydratase/carnithine racemase